MGYGPWGGRELDTTEWLSASCINFPTSVALAASHKFCRFFFLFINLRVFSNLSLWFILWPIDYLDVVLFLYTGNFPKNPCYCSLISFHDSQRMYLFTLCDFSPFKLIMGFPGGSDSEESACNVGDLDLIPGLGRSPGEVKGYPLQYSGLENHCMVHESQSRTWLSDFHSHPNYTKDCCQHCWYSGKLGRKSLWPHKVYIALGRQTTNM